MADATLELENAIPEMPDMSMEGESVGSDGCFWDGWIRDPRVTSGRVDGTLRNCPATFCR